MRSWAESPSDCGSRGAMNRTQRRVLGTSQAVFASNRCTAACMEARTARTGYPDNMASCIHITVDSRKAPQDFRKGRALDSADRNMFVVRRLLLAQKLCRGGTKFQGSGVVQGVGVGVAEYGNWGYIYTHAHAANRGGHAVTVTDYLGVLVPAWT